MTHTRILSLFMLLAIAMATPSTSTTSYLPSAKNSKEALAGLFTGAGLLGTASLANIKLSKWMLEEFADQAAGHSGIKYVSTALVFALIELAAVAASEKARDYLVPDSDIAFWTHCSSALAAIGIGLYEPKWTLLALLAKLGWNSKTVDDEDGFDFGSTDPEHKEQSDLVREDMPGLDENGNPTTRQRLAISNETNIDTGSAHIDANTANTNITSEQTDTPTVLEGGNTRANGSSDATLATDRSDAGGDRNADGAPTGEREQTGIIEGDNAHAGEQREIGTEKLAKDADTIPAGDSLDASGDNADGAPANSSNLAGENWFLNLI